MTRQQLAILQQNGSVTISHNGHGFSAHVVRNGGRSPARKNDGGDPDDGAPIASRPRAETDAEREERFATNRRINAQIKAESDKREASRLADIDGALARVQSDEAKRVLQMARSNGFTFDQVFDSVVQFETEWKTLLNLASEFRAQSLGLPTASASRSGRFLDDPDPDVRMFARMIANRQKLPGEELDEPEEETEPSSKKKKEKLGSREGQQEEFEEAKEGKIDKAGQTKGDDPDSIDIDEEITRYAKERAAEGWK